VATGLAGQLQDLHRARQDVPDAQRRKVGVPGVSHPLTDGDKDCAHARVAAKARATTAVIEWRTPRRLRGSVTFAKHSSNPAGAAGTSANSPSTGSLSSTTIVVREG